VSAYENNPEWQSAHRRLIDPPGGSSAERMVQGILAAVAMWAIESAEELQLARVGGAVDAA
jgi:hypothetical protein